MNLPLHSPLQSPPNPLLYLTYISNSTPLQSALFFNTESKYNQSKFPAYQTSDIYFIKTFLSSALTFFCIDVLLFFYISNPSELYPIYIVLKYSPSLQTHANTRIRIAVEDTILFTFCDAFPLT